MSNQIIQPLINPVKFVLIEPQDIPQYISKHLDDWLFEQQLRNFEDKKSYAQTWLKNDAVRLQYRSNFQPLTLKLFTCDNKEVFDSPFINKQQDFFFPDFYIRQQDLDLVTFEKGFYYFTIPELNWISEPFELTDEAPNTLYIEYSNSEMYQDIIFDSPFTPAIRVPAILKFKNVSSRDTIYADQMEAETMLNSVPYRIWEFILGGQGGVPDWLIDKVARIFGCDSLKIDGRFFTKADGATWERVELENYPMSGWKIELREKLNRSSILYENEVDIVGPAAAAIMVDTKGFGISDVGGDFLEIEETI